MSNLSQYIDKIKEYKKQHPDISEEELIRYVYLDLGRRFSFDLNFSFGNTKTKKKIYDNSRNIENLENAMESNTIICTSVSYIVEYILKHFGVNIRTEIVSNSMSKCPHMYNIVTPKEGEEYIIDLQEDLENIQSHSFTPNYGLSTKNTEIPVISRFDIEQMDRKLGYIDDEHYYSDDYLYLLKSDIGYFTDFAEKVEFVLGNIDIHENKKIEYAERKWHHEKILKELFSKKELNKIHMIDCYEGNGEKRQYKNCIAVESAKGTDIYMYSVEENRYCKIAIQEFVEQVQNGLVHLQKIPGLKQTLKTLSQDYNHSDDDSNYRS